MAAGAEGRVPWVVAAGLMAAVAVASLGSAAAATRHVVGGTTGWTIPPNSSLYSGWSSAQSFAVGDTLVFNFPTGAHNVIEVPKSSYDACSAKRQIGSTMSTGPATVTVASPGDHYYICGVGDHCSNGQKLAISVAPTTSAPSISPAGVAPGPMAGAPTTSPTAPAPTGSGSGNPSSSAPALPSGFTTAARFSLAIAALSATAFLL